MSVGLNYLKLSIQIIHNAMAGEGMSQISFQIFNFPNITTVAHCQLEFAKEDAGIFGLETQQRWDETSEARRHF